MQVLWRELPDPPRSQVAQGAGAGQCSFFTTINTTTSNSNNLPTIDGPLPPLSRPPCHLQEKMLAMEKHLEDCREAAERGFAWRDERDQLAAKVKAMNENTAGAAQQLEQLRTALFRWGALQRPELQRHKASLAAVKRSVLLWQEDSQAAIGSARQQLAAVVRAAQASRAAAEGAKDELAVVQDELRDTTAALVAREAELAAARRDASAAQARAADKMAQQQAMAAEEAARLQSQLDTAHQHLASAVAEDKQRKEEAARLSARLKAVG